MHIGYDVSQTGAGKAGCGYFSHAMIGSLLTLAPHHRYSLYPSFGDFYYDAKMPLKNPYQGGYYGPMHSTRELARSFWTDPGLEELVNKPDIVHSNNFWCPMQLKSSRLIYTFYDMGFVVNPGWTTETNRLGCFEGVFRSSVCADWIIAISEASKNHYLKIFPHFPEERIRVIYPCSRFADTALEGKRPSALRDIPSQGFWLTVGTIEPRKNQRRLAEIYARYLTLDKQPMPLVFAGGEGWLMEDFHDYLQKLDIEANIILTGYLSDEELIWLYKNCYANLYSSLFEGFGLPILEGMQFGAPTVSSNNTSMPEVGGSAAILLSAEDVESWAQTMMHLASDKNQREKLSEAAQNQARRFDWKHSASSLLQIYTEALASPKRNRIICETH